MTDRAWLEEAVGFYRSLGFFARSEGKPGTALAKELFEEHLTTWGEPLPPAVSIPPLPEVLVMSKDPDRAWWLDLECDAVPGNKAYLDALDRLAQISQGTFLPTDATEEWSDDGTRAVVSFDLGGIRHEVTAGARDDWFDVAFIGQLNAIVAVSGRRFCALSPGDQTILVVMLDDEERAALRERRGVDAAPLTLKEVA